MTLQEIPTCLGLGATIQIHPVTTPEELTKGVTAIRQTSHKYY